MSTIDVIVSGSLGTAGAVSAPIRAQAGQRLSYTVKGTFSGLVVIERSRGLQSWQLFATASAAASGLEIVDRDYYYRARCISLSVGTITYELRAFDATLFEEDHWDDLRFATAGINPPGAAADPSRDTADGTLLFSASVTNTIAMQTVFPHTWKTGSLIVPHVHWEKTSAAAGNVVWEFKIKVAEAGELFPAEWTTLSASTTVAGTPDDNSAGRHLITSFGPIALGATDVAPALKMLVSRLGGDAADTYGSNAKLIEFDIHYLKDSIGSGGEFTK